MKVSEKTKMNTEWEQFGGERREAERKKGSRDGPVGGKCDQSALYVCVKVV